MINNKIKFWMSVIYFIALFIALSYYNSFGQDLTLEDIKQVLRLQAVEEETIDFQADIIMIMNIEDNKYEAKYLMLGSLQLFASGFSRATTEAWTFYGDNAHNHFIPQGWWEYRPKTENVFGKSFSVQKVFREVDHFYFVLGYNNMKKYFGADKFWCWENFYASISTWVIWNAFATPFLDTYKYDRPFYSFNAELIFPFLF